MFISPRKLNFPFVSWMLETYWSFFNRLRLQHCIVCVLSSLGVWQSVDSHIQARMMSGLQLTSQLYTCELLWWLPSRVLDYKCIKILILSTKEWESSISNNKSVFVCYLSCSNFQTLDCILAMWVFFWSETNSNSFFLGVLQWIQLPLK